MWNGDPRPTAYVDSTTLQADMSAADITAVGNVAITVISPPPGGGTSNTSILEVIPEGTAANPVPVISGYSPGDIRAGDPGAQITVTGADFATGAEVLWNGSSLPTTYISDTTLIATIAAADMAVPGSAALSVSNPTPGGGTSGVISVSVLDASEFYDNFDRPDGADPLNGWTEKNALAFSLVSGQLQKNSVGTSYRDNVMYRPGSESRSDVETSVEFILNSSTPGYPQIFARLQPGSIASSEYLEGYILYVSNNSTAAVLGRQNGGGFVSTLSSITLSESLTTGTTYRLRMSAVGQNPVNVSGYVERLGPSGFVVIGQGFGSDSSAEQITAPGMSGIGGHVESSYAYDNFRDSDL